MKLHGYPPHLWVQPYKEVVTRVVLGFCISLNDNEVKLLTAARELEAQGFLTQDGEKFYAGGLWFTRFKPGPKLSIQDIKHAF